VLGLVQQHASPCSAVHLGTHCNRLQQHSCACCGFGRQLLGVRLGGGKGLLMLRRFV
jgi:hypothetical protein